MTALTAGFLANGLFNKSKLQASSPVIDGIKPGENLECKLEFVNGGILKPPTLPSNVIKLVPKSKSLGSPSNGFKHVFGGNPVSPAYESNGSPEDAGATSSSGSSYPSEVNTPESITKSLTDVPSPTLLKGIYNNGLEESADEEEETPKAQVQIYQTKTQKIEIKISSNLSTESVRSPSKTPQTPTKIIGPQLPPGFVLKPSPIPVSPSTSGISTPQKGIKRKRQLSERFEQEALYPVIEPTIASLNSWAGCEPVSGSPALAGIRNPHNNCFLNSVLQVVTHIPQFGRYIIENHSKGSQKCLGNGCMLCSLRAHIYRGLQNLVNDAGWVNRYLEDIFPNHIRGTQEDAHEMLLFLLDAIDRQQQSIRRSQPGKISSIVEQVFDGKIRCEYTCAMCQRKSICYEPIRGLSVELPRNQNMDQNHPTMSRIIRDFFADEKISGYDCKPCKRKTVANKRTRIVTAPNVLIIQLKRFLRYSKISDPVFVCKHMDVTDIMHDNDDVSYKLLGYIRHIGGSMSSGHYTATFTGFDGRSYHFDDETRTPVTFPQQKPIQPYILFYTKIQSTNTSCSTPIKPSPCQSPAKRQQLNGHTGTPVRNGNNGYKTLGHKVFSFNNGKQNGLNGNSSKENDLNGNSNGYNGNSHKNNNGYNGSSSTSNGDKENTKTIPMNYLKYLQEKKPK